MTLFKAGSGRMPMAYPVQGAVGCQWLIRGRKRLDVNGLIQGGKRPGIEVIGPGLAVNQAERTG
ncbi:MAG TPA: hypothetical protein DCZ91_09770 [Lachnospiraceae bacterium]|nr:hypothetical protein [Lachnospiraceae bacterium]